MPMIPEIDGHLTQGGKSGSSDGATGSAHRRDQRVGECGISDGDAASAERPRRTVCQIGTLVEYVPGRISSIQHKGWEEVCLVVDSGASETVIGSDMVPSAQLRDGDASKRGVEYEMADGSRVANEGEKKSTCISEENSQVGITAQVCDINKGLLSVKRMVDNDHKVVFEKAGGYIEDCKTGKRCG